ncbi:DUF4157 domain-containing protein [Deinococcus sp.]|uniref:eCIS core domain-containing protein n=1 Tax=Deinococcus sp. TaxID=47478 RepID=UPI0025BF6BAE|nr:DUF4157 domain-containing protein [Deinococcus sp.]
MEYQRKPQRPEPATRQASIHTPDPPTLTHLEAQGWALQRFTARPQAAQRQAAAPVLRAASLNRQEQDRLTGERATLQHQITTLDRAAPAQQPAQPPVPVKPTTPADWVTVMRRRAEGVEGQRLDTRAFGEFTALQRQVAQTLAHSFRSDRGEAQARYATYGEHLATLQRHALSAPVSRVVLGMVSPSERLPLQRATDEALQRQLTQEQAALNFGTLQTLQRQLAELDAEATQPVLQRIQARRGAGNPLSEAIQRHLEGGLNYDLSRVRIHDDAEADKLAKGVNAIAFTTGTDIYFQSGKFNPNSQSGLELLAHEVTHTVQQARGEVGPGIDPSGSHETQARAMGRKLASKPVDNLKNKAGRHLASTPARTGIYQNVIQKSADSKSTPEIGTTKVHPDVALKMLESYNSTGGFNFKPELGKGGASWFVTKGNPYVGIDASKNIPIEVNMAISKEALVFKEVDLIKLLREAEVEFKDAIDKEWIKRTGKMPTNSNERKAYKNFQNQFTETKMWDKVAAKIKVSGKGVGRVVLENSVFSKQGNGEFAVVTDPRKIKVKTSVGELIRSLNRSGYLVEKPIQEASEKLIKSAQIKGVVKGVYRYGGRLLIVVAVAGDIYQIYHAKDKKLAVVESVGGWAGATAAGSAFAVWFTPADVAGWPAWIAHGVGTLVAGGLGYWVGSKTTRTIYQLTLEGK